MDTNKILETEIEDPINRKTKAFVIFPAWETIIAESRDEYISYTFKKWLGENLYVSIECKKDSMLWEGRPDILCVSYCNRIGFNIAVEHFPLTREGYKAALGQLLHWADTFQTIFSDLRNYSGVEKKTEPVLKTELV